jgi:hypothetical protein
MSLTKSLRRNFGGATKQFHCGRLAAKNKCLADSNKSRTGDDPQEEQSKRYPSVLLRVPKFFISLAL